MKSLILPALLVTAAFASCGENEVEETTVAPAPAVVEAPAPVYQAPVQEEVETPVERAAEPMARPVDDRSALMPDEMRYRNMNQGYTAEQFERMGVAIEDDMYGTDEY